MFPMFQTAGSTYDERGEASSVGEKLISPSEESGQYGITVLSNYSSFTKKR
jgi:hypothetical protein